MKIAIMQPYFFPYLGYFSLIKNTDKFIIFDTPQFIRHGWIERNRILKPLQGWQYIRVPLIKHSRYTKINSIKIDNSKDWKRLIVAQLNHYKKKAPYYNEVMSLVNELLDEEFNDITMLNLSIIKGLAEYIGFDFDIQIFSKMDMNLEPVLAPDEWALNICKSLGNITEYWNPPGGMEFFSRDKYSNSGINLLFHKIKLQQYDQKRDTFEPGLSIIDVMMFNSKDDINKMLDDFELLKS